MNAQAKAWEKWLAGEEGNQCKDIATLSARTDYYLQNRLWRAFQAGYTEGSINRATTPHPAEGMPE